MSGGEPTDLNGDSLIYFPAWSKPVSAVLKHYSVSSPSYGLSSSVVAERQALYGPNELTKDPPESLWKLVLKQFDDTLVKVLLAAAAVSFVLAFGEDENDGEGVGGQKEQQHQ